MISRQSALNFLVSSGDKFNSFKAVSVPSPISILLKSWKLALSISQSFFSILRVPPEVAIESFWLGRPNNLRKMFSRPSQRMGPKEHHFGKQPNTPQTWKQCWRKNEVCWV